MWLEPQAYVILSYRIERFFCLLGGPVWPLFRLLIFPLILLLRILGGRHEISYRADIGRGQRVTHPCLGAVVHGNAIIGRSCVLAGGNSIGSKRIIERGELVLGDDVFLGINACVIGPAVIGSHVMIGAGAVVTGDLPDDCVAVGVPAKPLQRVGLPGLGPPTSPSG
jgi:serine O-acetyltransferase